MDNQVFTSQRSQLVENRKSDQEGSKKIILILVIIFVLVLGIVGAYFLGIKSQGNSSSLTPTPELVEASPTITETLTPTIASATISGTIVPTKKLSITPKQSLTPTPNIRTKIISASANLDGFRSSNNGGNESVDIRAGRNVNLVTRGFVSFDLGDIPSGAVITDATLRLYQGKVPTGDPYTAGGSIKVDHLTYGDSLDNSDYGMAALSSSFVTLTNNAALEWKDANVTDRLKDDISNARSRSQYRIHFQIETTGGDVTGDFAYFESAENYLHTGNTPQLVVKYY